LGGGEIALQQPAHNSGVLVLESLYGQLLKTPGLAQIMHTSSYHEAEIG